MKILHTSDWHLGKRLYGKTRIEEQRRVLEEITSIARDNAVDIVLIAGDIFDTFVPSAEAEQLFYESITEMAGVCLPVIISGNHDDEERLLAPDRMALAAGVAFAGSGLVATAKSKNGLSVSMGEDCVTVVKGDERVNIAVLPFPTSGKLLDLAGEKSFTDFVREKRLKACGCFTEDGYNIFLTHLFVTGAEGEITDERELGGSKLIPKSVLTETPCHYTALGHVHKPLCVSRSHNIYYSGSPCRYSFDDTSKKQVIILDTKGDTDIKRIELTSPTELVTVTASSEAEIEEKIAKCEGTLALIRYDSATPISPSFMSELRKKDCFCHIEVVKREQKSEAERRKGKTDRELFEMFYEKKHGEKPSEELVSLFLDAVSGEAD